MSWAGPGRPLTNGLDHLLSICAVYEIKNVLILKKVNSNVKKNQVVGNVTCHTRAEQSLLKHISYTITG